MKVKAIFLALLLCVSHCMYGYAAEETEHDSAVHFERELDSYDPLKNHYHFFFT